MKWYQKLLGIGALAVASLTFSPKAKACSDAIPIGRGGTNVAIADGASAVYWNPAGLIQLERPELDITTATKGRYKGFICYGKKLNDKNAIGINLTYRNIESEIENNPDYNTLWLKLGYSRKLTNKLSVGANLTIERDYYDDEIITWNFGDKTFQTYLNADLGILYKPNKKVNLGLLIQGYAPNHFYNIRPGISIRPNDKTLLSVEGYDVTDTANSRHVRFGLEKRVNDRWSVRAGLRINKEGTNPGAPFDGSLGGSIGASYRRGNLETSIAKSGKGLILTLNKKF